MTACAEEKTIKVSVITPCFNSVETIRQTIESVLNQTYKDIEYIVVDGGSSDGTVDIIREYLPRFRGRMKYVSETDRGIYDAMNKGIRMSGGELIGIINSDDFYEPYAIATVVSHVSSDKYQVIYGYCRLLEGERERGVLKNCHQDLKDQMIPHPTCFVKRKVYCDFGMFLTCFKIADDYELMCRLYSTGQVKFVQVRQVIASFRMGGTCGNLALAEKEAAFIAFYHRLISLRELVIRLVAGI